MKNSDYKYSIDNPICQQTISSLVFNTRSTYCRNNIEMIYETMKEKDITFKEAIDICISERYYTSYIRMYNREFARIITSYNKRKEKNEQRKIK